MGSRPLYSTLLPVLLLSLTDSDPNVGVIAEPGIIRVGINGNAEVYIESVLNGFDFFSDWILFNVNKNH